MNIPLLLFDGASSHLRNHQSCSWHCSQLCLSAPSPMSPSPPIRLVSSTTIHLMTSLAFSLQKHSQSHCLCLATNKLQQHTKQTAIPPIPSDTNHIPVSAINAFPELYASLSYSAAMLQLHPFPPLLRTVSQSLAHASNPIKPDGLVA